MTQDLSITHGEHRGFPALLVTTPFSTAAAVSYTHLDVYKRQEKMLKTKLEKHTVLNVNIPAVVPELLKGFKICKQAYAKYEEDFIERNDPHGRHYYWLTGEFVNFDKAKDTDVWALDNNYVSIVPVQFDLTNYVLKAKLEKSWK